MSAPDTDAKLDAILENVRAIRALLERQAEERARDRRELANCIREIRDGSVAVRSEVA